MDSQFNKLLDTWENSKKKMNISNSNLDALYSKIKRKQKENFLFYYRTIIILSITLIVVYLFFYQVVVVKEILSKIGAGLMVLGLLFRILIEIISVYKAKQIDKLNNSLKTTQNIIDFHLFRKKIHGIITPIIVALYSVGFYMITPEFSSYMNRWSVVAIDVSYIIIAVILFIVIGKNVKKEIKQLNDIVKLKSEIME